MNKFTSNKINLLRGERNVKVSLAQQQLVYSTRSFEVS